MEDNLNSANRNPENNHNAKPTGNIENHNAKASNASYVSKCETCNGVGSIFNEKLKIEEYCDECDGSGIN